MKFCIGDIVRGNKEADQRYGITTSKCTGEVVGVEVCAGEEYITLKVISHDSCLSEVGHKYEVLSDCFELVDDSWNGLFRTANSRKLFVVKNGTPTVNNVGKDSPCYKQLCAEYSEYMKKKEK